MAKYAGLECPWCGHKPNEGFKTIKTFKLSKHTERGHKCPKCKRSFISIQESKKQTFFKKEFPGDLSAGY